MLYFADEAKSAAFIDSLYTSIAGARRRRLLMINGAGVY